MRHRALIGSALICIGAGLLGQRSIRLLPFDNSIRIAVQSLSNVAIGIAGIVLDTIWRNKRTL
ncbi:MAG: hypothetical protein N2663_01080 [Chlorobi bacterium]|nr:hypothetical protein [Chlorobiota bacterium]